MEWQNISMLSPYKNRRVLFYAIPSYTGFAQYLSFGWHGNTMFDRFDVLYTIPKVLFWIPVLREFLLASGAVENSMPVLERLLKKEGRAVCHCHGGMQVAGTQKMRDVSTLKEIDDAFIHFLIEEDVVVVPVVFTGELKRYPPLFGQINDLEFEPWTTTLFKHYLFKLQHLSLEKFGYPFPLIHGWNRNYNIQTSISAPIDMKSYNVHQLKEAKLSIHTAWRELGNGGDETVEILIQ